MLHSLSQALTSVEGIPEIWRTTGRPCIPRILFSFQVSLVQTSKVFQCGIILNRHLSAEN